jgi:hypothetical protein
MFLLYFVGKKAYDTFQNHQGISVLFEIKCNKKYKKEARGGSDLINQKLLSHYEQKCKF